MQSSTAMQRILNHVGYYFNKKCVSSTPKGTIKNIQTGDKISVTRTVTSEDIMSFAQLTNDFNPIHVNSKNKLVHGALLNGFLSGVLGTNFPGPGTIVIKQYIHYPKPCYAGDTIEITVEVLSARKIIECGYRIIEVNSGRVVLEGDGKFVVDKEVSSGMSPIK